MNCDALNLRVSPNKSCEVVKLLPTGTVFDIIYTDKPDIRWNHMMCLTKQRDKYSLFIMQALRENKIFYSTNEVGEIVRNYVLWSDSFSIKN